jgi:hypothetical protein
VLPIRERERVIAFKRAAEPGIFSMQGTDQRADSGGMNTEALPSITRAVMR